MSAPSASVENLAGNLGALSIDGGGDDEQRLKMVRRKKDFEFMELFKGRLVNIVQGLELHTNVFSPEEQKQIVDCVYQFQKLGRRGLLRVVLILVNQWLVKGFSNMFEHSQLFGGSWLGSYSAVCFSCGYFAYDQLDMLRFQLYSGGIPSILVHHLILLVCFTFALYRNVTINYLILTLICELHSIFLHVRKVRKMAGVRNVKSVSVKTEWVLNWATFFIARVGCHILITYKLITDASKFGKGVELPLALFGMAGMNLLNVFLGLDLLKAYKRERSQQMNQGKYQD